MESVFMYSGRFLNFDYGRHHPFKTHRAKLTYELCYRYGLFDAPETSVFEPEPALEESLFVFHSEEYIEALKRANSEYFDVTMLEHGLGTADNPVFRGVYDFSLLALGATLTGVELIGKNKADIVFNPNGGLHHAGPGVAEGFCYVNDIVIAIKRLEELGFERILYVDIDAHHGNAVQDAFYESDKVFVFSLHQSGDTIYPGTGFENEMGRGKGYGYTLNMPLPEYTDDESYVRTFRELYRPVTEAFSPQVVVAQIGLDTLKKDPLTNLRCTNNGYCRVMEEIASSCSKIIALGGGGYSVEDVARGWTLAWAILNDIEPVDPYAGIVGGSLYGHEKAGDDLRDAPHRISSKLKCSVERYLDSKIKFLKEHHFPLIGIP